MADIKQAAKWLKQGFRVRRFIWADGHYLRFAAFSRPPQFLWDRYEDNDPDDAPASIWVGRTFMMDDLLADDWEVVS